GRSENCQEGAGIDPQAAHCREREPDARQPRSDHLPAAAGGGGPREFEPREYVAFGLLLRQERQGSQERQEKIEMNFLAVLALLASLAQTKGRTAEESRRHEYLSTGFQADASAGFGDLADGVV